MKPHPLFVCLFFQMKSAVHVDDGPSCISPEASLLNQKFPNVRLSVCVLSHLPNPEFALGELQLFGWLKLKKMYSPKSTQQRSNNLCRLAAAVFFDFIVNGKYTSQQ